MGMREDEMIRESCEGDEAKILFKIWIKFLLFKLIVLDVMRWFDVVG